MPIPVSCQCGQRFAVKETLAGKRVKCPKCNSIFAVPNLPSLGLQPLDSPLQPLDGALQPLDGPNDPLSGGGGSPQSPFGVTPQSAMGGPVQPQPGGPLPSSPLSSPQLGMQSQWGTPQPQKTRAKSKQGSKKGLIIGLSVGGGAALVTAIVVIVLLSNDKQVAGSSDEAAREFLSAIANGTKRLKTAGFEFGKTVGPALAGRRVDSSALQQSLSELLQTVNDLKSEMQNITPPRSSSARGLYNAHQKFLDGQERMVSTEMQQIVQIIEDDTISPQFKRTRIQLILVRVTANEASAGRSLTAALMAFAREHKISPAELKAALR